MAVGVQVTNGFPDSARGQRVVTGADSCEDAVGGKMDRNRGRWSCVFMCGRR
jgi:hypothetical protein